MGDFKKLKSKIARFKKAETIHPEWDEYEGNDYTRATFPGAFKDAKHFTKLVSDAPIEHVHDFSSVENTDAGNQDAHNREQLTQNLAQYQERFKTKDEMDGYHQKLMKGIKAGKSPPSLIGVHKDPQSGKTTRYLLAGNTRALMHRYLGLPVKVKHIPLAGPYVKQPD